MQSGFPQLAPSRDRYGRRDHHRGHHGHHRHGHHGHHHRGHHGHHHRGHHGHHRRGHHGHHRRGHHGHDAHLQAWRGCEQRRRCESRL